MDYKLVTPLYIILLEIPQVPFKSPNASLIFPLKTVDPLYFRIKSENKFRNHVEKKKIKINFV